MFIEYAVILVPLWIYWLLCMQQLAVTVKQILQLIHEQLLLVYFMYRLFLSCNNYWSPYLHWPCSRPLGTSHVYCVIILHLNTNMCSFLHMFCLCIQSNEGGRGTGTLVDNEKICSAVQMSLILLHLHIFGGGGLFSGKVVGGSW